MTKEREIVQLVEFAAGDHLFHEGDVGGDLFFIETGTVEIYRRVDGVDAQLALMGEGEVIGVLTCLTSDPRLASARAKTSVTCKVVRQKDVVRSLKSLPEWIKIIIKEFNLRLSGMNERYMVQLKELKKLRRRTVDPAWLSAQIAGIAGEFAESVAIAVDEKKFVVIRTFIEKLAASLNCSEAVIEAIFEVFFATGVLRQEVEPDRKQKVFPLAMAKNLAALQKFYNESRSGKKKHWLTVRFRHRELETLQGLIRLLIFRKADMGTGVKLSLPDLHGNMQREIGVEFKAESLVLPKKLDLVQLKKDGEGNRYICFHPRELARNIDFIQCFRRLNEMDIDSIGDDQSDTGAGKAA